MIKRGSTKYGPTAKQLGKIAKFKIKISPEVIDTDGFFEDGMRAAKYGNSCNTGSLKLIENIEAFRNGYKTGERIYGYLCR